MYRCGRGLVVLCVHKVVLCWDWSLLHRVHRFCISTDAVIRCSFFYTFSTLTRLDVVRSQHSHRIFDKAKISDEHQCVKTFIHRFTCLTCFTAAHEKKNCSRSRQPLAYNQLRYTVAHRIIHSAVWCFSNWIATTSSDQTKSNARTHRTNYKINWTVE